MADEKLFELNNCWEEEQCLRMAIQESPIFLTSNSISHSQVTLVQNTCIFICYTMTLLRAGYCQGSQQGFRAPELLNEATHEPADRSTPSETCSILIGHITMLIYWRLAAVYKPPGESHNT